MKFNLYCFSVWVPQNVPHWYIQNVKHFQILFGQMYLKFPEKEHLQFFNVIVCLQVASSSKCYILLQFLPTFLFCGIWLSLLLFFCNLFPIKQCLLLFDAFLLIILHEDSPEQLCHAVNFQGRGLAHSSQRKRRERGEHWLMLCLSVFLAVSQMDNPNK